MTGRMLLRQLRRVLLTALLGGLLGATLIRYSPGFGIDEMELDARAGHELKDQMRAQHAGERNVLGFYLRYLARLLQGDLGSSHVLNRPVSELVRERLPLTLESLSCGVAGAFLFGFCLALLSVSRRSHALEWLSSLLSVVSLSLPAGLIGLFFLWMRRDASWAIAVAVFPYVYRYSRNLLASSYGADHVFAAHTRGLSELHILFAYVLRPLLPEIFALGAATVSIGMGATIPIEVICDSPGIGQLVWRAALGRDLPVLVAVTLLVTIVTVAANSIADLALNAWSPSRTSAEVAA